jgi:hypothetical protein
MGTLQGTVGRKIEEDLVRKGDTAGMAGMAVVVEIGEEERSPILEGWRMKMSRIR